MAIVYSSILTRFVVERKNEKHEYISYGVVTKVPRCYTGSSLTRVCAFMIKTNWNLRVEF